MIVIDASAASNVVREGKSSPFSAFLEHCDEKTIAPRLFGIEAAQTAWKYAHIGALDEAGAASMFRDILSCVDDLYSDAELAGEALSEAVRLDHSFYDMLYFVLARRTSSPLLTCDKRLAAICQRNNVECVEPLDF